MIVERGEEMRGNGKRKGEEGEHGTGM